MLDWSKAHIIKTDLQQFLRGGYNLIFNNCEHFANACTLGKYRSHQVENFFGGNNMGILSTIGGWIGSLFGGGSSRSSSSHSYNYEPDKVRVAEIERDTRLRLAEKENERIELMRDAQLELLKAQMMSQMAIDKARVEGMKELAAQLVVLQEKMLDVAQKQIAIIEAGALPIVREIENFYAEISDKIIAANDDYNTKKLPQLLKLLGQFERGSTEHEIFTAQINDDRARQGKFIEQQMNRISERQNLVLQSFLSSKEKIIEQTGQITQSLAEGFLKRQAENLLPQGQASLQALPTADLKALPAAD